MVLKVVKAAVLRDCREWVHIEDLYFSLAEGTASLVRCRGLHSLPSPIREENLVRCIPFHAEVAQLIALAFQSSLQVLSFRLLAEHDYREWSHG